MTVVDIRPEVDHVLVALRGELDIATIAELRGRMARPPAGLMGIRDKLAHALREHS